MDATRSEGVEFEPDAMEAIVAISQGCRMSLQDRGYVTWRLVQSFPITQAGPQRSGAAAFAVPMIDPFPHRTMPDWAPRKR